MEGWAAELLSTARTGVLATVSPTGWPQAVPVCYVVYDDKVVSPIDEKPKSGRPLGRLRNIVHEPRVSLLVDCWDEEWHQLAWVRVEGRTEVVARGEQMPEALAALRAKYPQYRQMALEWRPLIVITVERVAAWRAAP